MLKCITNTQETDFFFLQIYSSFKKDVNFERAPNQALNGTATKNIMSIVYEESIGIIDVESFERLQLFSVRYTPSPSHSFS